MSAYLFRKRFFSCCLMLLGSLGMLGLSLLLFQIDASNAGVILDGSQLTEDADRPYVNYVPRNEAAISAVPLKTTAGELHVCFDGCVYSSTQAAVDAAHDGDVIKIATGVYTGVHVRDSVTQVIYISKSITLRGSYTTTNWLTPDPEAYPTTLDAQEQGRVLYITGEISSTIEGLRITGGNADGLGRDSETDAGGGIYIVNAKITIRNNQVFSNSAGSDANVGGGIYILNSNGVLLSGNTISHHSNDGRGSGLFLKYSPGAVLDGNVIANNWAGSGGGLVLWHSPSATLVGNTIISNTAIGHSSNYGGGAHFFSSDNITLTANIISGNQSQYGGGLSFEGCNDIKLDANTITGNDGSHGGGVYIKNNERADLRNNTINYNSASTGGGVDLTSTVQVTLIGNTIIGNSFKYPLDDNGGGGLSFSESKNANAINNTIVGNSNIVFGGGLRLRNSDVRMVNNTIVDNQANVQGDGIFVEGTSSSQLLHTTIARNGGATGSGLYITGASSAVTLTNTILVGHAVGITITAGNTATLEATLWGTDTWANDTDWGGDGAIITGSVNVWGDPHFVDSDTGNYHICSESAARDAGVDAGIVTDLDGDPRPAGGDYDIGADEFSTCYARITSNPSITYTTVQAAVDAAIDEDVVKVAGTCTGVESHGGITQVVYISKSITLRGGYATTNWTISDPETNPTILDAQRGGRVIYLDSGDVILENLRITGGNTKDRGGGIYNDEATLTLSNTVVVSNFAGSDGGGVCVAHGSTMVRGGQIISNTASDKGGGVYISGDTVTFTQAGSTSVIAHNTATNDGGGVYISYGSMMLSGGRISNNTAKDHDGGGVYVGSGSMMLSEGQILNNRARDGGGIYVNSGMLSVSGGQIISNTAGYGGGVRVEHGRATLNGGQITSNSAISEGGGVYIWTGNTTLNRGQINNNSARYGGGVYVRKSGAVFTQTGVSTIAHNIAVRQGGGVYVREGNATLSGGQIISNFADKEGGGVYVEEGSATLSGEQILSNTAQKGGGIYISESTANTLINTVVADNRVAGLGGGLYIEGGAAQLLHTTIVRNTGGDGSGVYVTNDGSDHSIVAMTNTILVSHTVGITVTAGNTVTLEATLWGTGTWANGVNYSGTGKITTGSINVWGNSAFVNPDAGDYHIRVGSAARDRGINAGVNVDIDGLRRPQSAGYDIGADEWGSLTIYLPLVLRNWPPVPDLYPIANADGDGNYEVCWSAIDLADDYVLEEAIYDVSAGWSQVYTDAHICHAITDKGPTRFYYRVKARNGWSDNVWSNVQSVDVLWEQEPNNSRSEANGPLIFGESYFGYPNDLRDYFKINVPAEGRITVDLINHAGTGVQLLLLDQEKSPCDKDWNPPYQIRCDLSAGQYYIYIYTESGHNSTTAYTLTATFSTH